MIKQFTGRNFLGEPRCKEMLSRYPNPVAMFCIRVKFDAIGFESPSNLRVNCLIKRKIFFNVSNSTGN